MKKLFFVLVVLVLVVGVVFVDGYVMDVKMGVIFGFIGLIELLILDMVVGVEFVMVEVLVFGGLLGGMIVILICKDLICVDVVVVLIVVEELVVEGVVGIFGVDCLGVIGVVFQNVVVFNGVVMVLLLVISLGLLIMEDNGLFFCIVLLDVCQGVVMVELLMEQGYMLVVVFYINLDYGKGLVDSFQVVYEGLGGEVIILVLYEVGKGDYLVEVGVLVVVGGDLLVVVGYVD